MIFSATDEINEIRECMHPIMVKNGKWKLGLNTVEYFYKTGKSIRTVVKI